ncbi:MAG: Maf family nucleotide pyrophosphatase [Bacteroidota bacterium]
MIEFSHPLILASGSPRRKMLLESLGWEFSILTREASEYFPQDLHPRAIAVLISENKAKVYDDLSNKNIVLTADTLVVQEGEVLGKPTSPTHAIEMLQKLSSSTHLVITGVTLFNKGKFRSFSVETKVNFRSLTAKEISYYVDNFSPLDKAGAYGIQDWIGKIGITSIEGDYYNVMGLPISRLYEELIPFMK